MKIEAMLSKLEKKAAKRSVTDIDFNKYCEDIGFEPNLIKNLNHHDDSLENEAVDMIIVATRKSIALIYFKNLAILNAKLEAYYKGEIAYPSDDVRNLKILFDIYNQACSYSPLSNIDAAMRTVQSIPGFSVLIDKNANIP
jgi:hypothetical protein